MITFALETWASYRADCDALWREHYAEIAADKRMPMRPDEAAYRANEAAGQLQIVTARQAGELVGYMLHIVRPHPHYADVLCGFEDSYFLSSGHRRGLTGARLIRESERFLRARGVKRTFIHTKTHTSVLRRVGELLARLGYVQCDVTYTKWIGEAEHGH